MFKNGLVSMKLDTHLHTKSDKEFTYNGDENSFIKEYVQALTEAHIGIAFITNHNKFNKDEYCAIRKKAKKENIFVLPGVELSVKEGANGLHMLIIFNDDEWLNGEKDDINTFLDTAFTGASDNRENENTRCSYDIPHLIEALDKHKKDYFIIPAHVEQASGLLKECNGGLIESLWTNPKVNSRILALQKVKTRDKYEKFKTWTNIEYPCVEGSDPKSIEEIVTKSSDKCYLKIGEFSFSAVKFAFLSWQDRLFTELPTPNHSYIKSICFSGGKLDKQRIDFSSGLNSLIGIRGSGKSAILESIRKMLGKPPVVDKKYKDDLVTHIIGSGGKIIVEINDQHGKEYTLNYIMGEEITIYDSDDELIQVTSDALVSQPLYFGQKDLSDTRSGYELELLNKLVGDNIIGVMSSIEDVEVELLEALQLYISFDNIKNQIVQKKKERDDLKHKLKIFKEKGLEDKLEKQSSFNKDKAEINKIVDKFPLTIKGDIIKDTSAALRTKIFKQFKYTSKYNAELFEKIRLCLKKVSQNSLEIEKIIQEIDVQFSEITLIQKEFESLMSSLVEEFADIRRDINDPSIDPDKYLEYQKKHAATLEEIGKLKTEHTKKTECVTTIKHLIDKRNEILRAVFTAYEKEIKRINESQKELKLTIEFKGDKDAFYNILIDIFQGTGITETKYREIMQVYTDVISFASDLLLDNVNDNIKDVLTTREKGKAIDKAKEKLRDLIKRKTPDKVIIKYHGKELIKHSLGQRASALLLFILAQEENSVIIIDQPEDDLDNQVIYNELIQRIKERKKNVQFLFATHNANIPVLGDSEKIVCLSFDNDSLISIDSGTIDDKKMQKLIVDIMEGGSDAFEKRQRIYSEWK